MRPITPNKAEKTTPNAYCSGANVIKRVEYIKQMLIAIYGLDEDDAHTYAYEFSKYFASKYD